MARIYHTPTHLTFTDTPTNDPAFEMTALYQLIVRMIKGSSSFVTQTAPRGLATTEFNRPVIISISPELNQYLPLIRIKDRRFNIWFAMFEALWMWGCGGNDVERISYFNKQIKKFSDDGTTFNGAYGYRAINHFGVDQIQAVIDLLASDPDSRKAVIQIYDPRIDTGSQTLDMPCNVSVMFKLVKTKDGNNYQLNMVVTRRSNDLILGLPHNLIQFYALQSIIAASLSSVMKGFWQVTMGSAMHVIDCLHYYHEDYGHKLNDVVFNEKNYICPGTNRARPFVPCEKFGDGLSRWFGYKTTPNYREFAKVSNGIYWLATNYEEGHVSTADEAIFIANTGIDASCDHDSGLYGMPLELNDAFSLGSLLTMLHIWYGRKSNQRPSSPDEFQRDYVAPAIKFASTVLKCPSDSNYPVYLPINVFETMYDFCKFRPKESQND